ncbi:hypothetical protein TNCV_4839971 [Trichonephila clavipes]|nr:hypothetical protein TNCV_4839971 [Trichonephila clavipes]
MGSIQRTQSFFRRQSDRSGDMIRNGEADLSFHLLSMTESRDSVIFDPPRKERAATPGEQVAGHRWFFSENSQVNVDSAVVNSRRVLRRVAGGKHWKKYFLSGDVLQLSNLAMPVRKGFCHKHKLQTIVSRVNNGGLLAKVIREEGSKFWARFPELERDENPEENLCHVMI